MLQSQSIWFFFWKIINVVHQCDCCHCWHHHFLSLVCVQSVACQGFWRSYWYGKWPASHSIRSWILEGFCYYISVTSHIFCLCEYWRIKDLLVLRMAIPNPAKKVETDSLFFSLLPMALRSKLAIEINSILVRQAFYILDWHFDLSPLKTQSPDPLKYYCTDHARKRKRKDKEQLLRKAELAALSSFRMVIL